MWGLDGNVLSRSVYARGDVDAAFAASAHVVHEVYQTQRIEHAFLEPESTLVGARSPAAVMHVYSGGQGVWDDRDQIASVLGIDAERITVELVSNGGAFGGKEDMSNQAQTALAAWLLGRAGEVHAVARGVAAASTRSATRCASTSRSAATPTAGSPRCGRAWSATRVRTRRSGMKVLERAAGHASGPYRLPAIDVEAIAARTNNSVCGAFRGFGANQAQFAMEGALDRLAELVGISGWEIRSRNVVDAGRRVGSRPDHGRRLPRCSALPRRAEARLRGRAGRGPRGRHRPRAQELGPRQRLPRDRPRRSCASSPTASSRCATAGPRWARACTPSPRRSRSRSSASTPSASGCSSTPPASSVRARRPGSRGTLMGAGAVADACQAARADGCQIGIDYQGEYRVDWTSSIESGVEHPVIHSAFGYAVAAGRDRPRHGRHRAGRRRARRRPGGQPVAVRQPDRGRGAHGPRLRAHRGLPVRRRRPTARHHPARPRHHPGQGRARRST